MANNQRDYYTILGVEPNATQEQIKLMYHKLAKKYHADANSDDPQLRKWSHENMIELNDAYSVLKDPIKRKEYDQQKSTNNYGNTDEQFASEMVFIQTMEQAKEILNEGVDNFPFGAPTPDLEEDCKQETKKLINKKPQNYLRMGVPNEYPMAYLAAAVENAAAEAMERIQEKVARMNVFSLFFVVVLIIGAVVAFREADNILRGAFMVFGLTSLEVLYYFVFTWIARFIARGFKSNLIGRRGFLVNGLIAIALVVIYISSSFFNPEKDGETWKRYTSQDNEFSVLLPFEPKEKEDGIFHLSNGQKTARKKMFLEASKEDFHAEFNVYWASHPNLPSEYEVRLEDYESSMKKDGGKIVSRKKLSKKSHSFVVDLPNEYSVASRMFIDGETIYFMVITTEDRNINDEAVPKFLNSIETN
ncbi:MAG: DnaJ domain-containing protein [Bacteroidetes bacterium]|nr:DnaJ domain-containing protein [Bacteroidota bacterium]